MNMEFSRKLPDPMEAKDMYPLTDDLAAAVRKQTAELTAIFSGESGRIVLIIGPCSADREDSVIDYVSRLVAVQEKVKDRILIIPRIYTNKPRTTGDGYKGLVHQPNPTALPNLLMGIIATRELHLRVIRETGFAGADEMLYPENYAYLDDLLSYVAVGARSVEDQQHRLTASAIECPVGMKNPTSGERDDECDSGSPAPARFHLSRMGRALTGEPVRACDSARVCESAGACLSELSL